MNAGDFVKFVYRVFCVAYKIDNLDLKYLDFLGNFQKISIFAQSKTDLTPDQAGLAVERVGEV